MNFTAAQTGVGSSVAPCRRGRVNWTSAQAPPLPGHLHHARNECVDTPASGQRSGVNAQRGTDVRKPGALHVARAVPAGAQEERRASPRPSPPSALGPLAILALDVEFTHLELASSTSNKEQLARPGRSRRALSVATWVCVVDRFGTVPPPLKSYIGLPPDLRTEPCDNADKENGGSGGVVGEARYRVVGGVKEGALRGAPCLAEVRQQVLSLLREGGCKTLVGHGISKDLQSLGINEEADLWAHGVRTCDTMSFPKFQGRGGLSKTLAVLAKEFLGRQIQACRGAHDPEEDARAAMDLYVRHVDYECMVEYETRRLLSRAAAVAAAAEAAQHAGADGGGARGDGHDGDGDAEAEEK
ncbi:hypothetical protein HXX76_007405 [Chlamydomonas incerta]|uniref:Exonuclease domain-containing protein n=1 Tax=Chlamydomonas incerta TaxID=51695 RepID=A0A835T100_CHLIN|nr:hypothetical protein HXX76_007405 [Chlamydomonas incerta]|eukprot:KAG2435331.1 hypothetical protein HXX76_007405 [Chlamydomonas incerta]